jgi:hypothetical protein
MLLLLSTFLTATAPSGGPAPPVCPAIDTETDTLTEDERRVALALLAQAVQAWGRPLAAPGCPQPVTVSHVKVGDVLSVVLRTAEGARLGRAPRMEDLPATYLQLLRGADPASGPGSRAADTAAGAASPGAPPPPSPSEEPASPGGAPPEAARRPWFGFGAGHGHFYARLGYHGSVRDELKTGPSLGIGYRFEVGRLLLDASTLNVDFWREDQRDSYDSNWNAFLRLMAFRYLDDVVGADLYAGAGLSYGRLETRDYFRGDGLQGELGLGYEILRETAVRAFIQAVVTLPFYRLYGEQQLHPLVSTPVRDYGFSGALSIGVGF